MIIGNNIDNFQEIRAKFENEAPKRLIELMNEAEQGRKENIGKLNYELDWEFIEDMARRMAVNKGKNKFVYINLILYIVIA